MFHFFTILFTRSSFQPMEAVTIKAKDEARARSAFTESTAGAQVWAVVHACEEVD